MRLSLHAVETELDVDLTVGSETVTIADVFIAAGLSVDRQVLIGGRVACDVNTPIGALGLADGTTLMARDPDDRGGGAEAVAELVCVAGPGAGTRTSLTPGTFDFCQVADRARPSNRGSVFRIEVGRSGSCRIGALAGSELVVDGEPAGEDLRPGAWIAAGRSVFRLARIDASERAGTASGPVGSAGLDGRVAFVRSPRLVDDGRVRPVVAPKPPTAPRPPEPLSLLLLVVPLPIGLALAYFLSPFYLVFLLLAPIMAIGRSLDGKRRVTRTTRENAIRWRDDVDRFQRELSQVGAEVAAHRRGARRDLHRLARSAASGDAGLWRSRPPHDDFLRPVVGVGLGRIDPEVLGDTSPPDLEAALAEARAVPMCPVSVDLAGGLAIGIVGPRDVGRRLAAAIVAQLVTEHGPADVQLAALLDGPASRFWDHLKWLPHMLDEVGAPQVASTAVEAETLVATLVREPERVMHRSGDERLDTPVPVFVVDNDALAADGVRSLATRLPRVLARAVIVADTVDDLPAFCTSMVEIDPASGSVDVTDVGTGRRDRGLVGLFPDRELCRDISRSLARFVDPDAGERALTLPTFARLGDILETGPTADQILASWSAGLPATGGSTVGCRAVVGVTETGPLDVDLVGDGPHALIAGTTGAGKSELLRTMVVSMAARYRPDEVNLVLVDFKGGGAFDAFARLPHNVGVVTDLDEHLASRALRCLRAELTYREHRLRAAGVSDVGDLVLGPDDLPLPRLVIVVDEFATLAAELPEFLTSLVDVAQRGRSLGLHMVLATQRPSGVVDAKIRANTNLRIALRVQDDLDSIDVIGSGDAADIDRRHPGRALARFGAAELIAFQTALVSVHSGEQAGPALRLDPFDLVGGGTIDPDPAPFDRPEPASPTGPDDLARYVDAAAEANKVLGLAPARVPWPDPLPTRLAAEPLLAAAGTGSTERWAAPFGLVDRPDLQRHETAWWRADDGNLLVYGIGPGPGSQAVSTVIVSLARRHSADELHLYVLDFVGSLAALRGLPHLGGYVTADDDERLLRTVQLLEDELDRRRGLVRQHQIDGVDAETAARHRLPLVVLTVANYGAVVETFEEIGEHGGPNRLARIVRDGPSLGVFVFIAAGSERDVPGRVAQQIESKLLTRMADPNAYLIFGLRPKDVPELGPGRAIDVRTQHEIQIAQFGDGDLRASIESGRWTGSDRGPAPVEALGHNVAFDRVAGASRSAGSTWRLAVAIGHQRLTPVALELRNGHHLVVTGPSGSGRTTALRSLAAAARQSDPGAVLAVVTADADEWDDLRAPLDLTTIDYLMSPESGDVPGRRALILVDGLETASVPTPVFERLASQPPPGIHLVVAGRPESFRVPDPWVRPVVAGRSGLALRPSPESADVFRCRFPTPRELDPPGRAYVVNQGQPELAQVVRPPTGGRPAEPSRPEPPSPPRTESPGGDVEEDTRRVSRVAHAALDGDERAAR